ncbi:MAG: helix-turn-helix domain-containing protein [Firmicutes bacterium]|nr:helix-turn-helix domain-containing protein [Bacillota bacterium]
MDNKKIGAFITEKRKAKNLTQQDLAEKLCVTVQCVSKWECGKGIPDSSLMLKLGEVLGISVTELLDGAKKQVRAYGGVTEEERVALKKEYNETTSAKIWFKINLLSIFQSVFWITMFLLSTFLGWGEIATTVLLVMMVLNATIPFIILLVRIMLFSMWLNIVKNIKDEKLKDMNY